MTQERRVDVTDSLTLYFFLQPVASRQPPAAQPPPVRLFPNCDAMREAGWTRGVARDGGTYEPAWNDAERRTYALNTARDRDGDGRACE